MFALWLPVVLMSTPKSSGDELPSGEPLFSDTLIVCLLLSKGARIDNTDRYGRTVLMTAVKRRHLETVRVLVEQGARLNAKDKVGRTARSL